MSVSPASSSSSEAAQSENSTLVYDQVPFEQYVSRVKDLVHTKWPSIAAEDFTVARMKGGGENRIIRLSVQDKAGAERSEYVLRIPRFDAAKVLNDVAPVQFMCQLSNLPVPEVVAFDCTPYNVLESQYMILRRLHGTPLISVYPGMNHKLRCGAARQLGEATACLASLQSPHIGRLTTAGQEPLGGEREFLVQALEGTGPEVSWPYSNAPPSQDISETLLQIFEYRESVAMAQDPPDDYDAEYMQRFANMTRNLSDMGHLEGVAITLCHLDFLPRNFLVDVQNHTALITGILDWDSAIFAPSFMSCTPPTWIWAWTDGEEEEEKEQTANDIPTTQEACELKGIFEQAAGPTYLRFAYNPVYRLARRLVKFACNGMGSNEDANQADSMLDEWSEVHQDET